MNPTRRYRIAVVAACPFPSLRGSQVLVRELAAGLAHAGHSVHVVTYPTAQHLAPVERIAIHRVRKLPGLWTAHPFGWQKVVLDLLLAWRLLGVVRQQRIDIIHAHNVEAPLVAFLVRWLTGLDPVEVSAVGSALAEPRLADYDDVDTSAVTLRLPTGALVQIDSIRRTSYGYDERIEVFGSEGMVETQRRRTGAVSRYRAGQVIDDGLHPGWFELVKPTYAAALAHFVSALEDGTAPTPSLEDGLKAQAIAEAATRSLHSGRTERIEY